MKKPPSTMGGRNHKNLSPSRGHVHTRKLAPLLLISLLVLVFGECLSPRQTNAAGSDGWRTITINDAGLHLTIRTQQPRVESVLDEQEIRLEPEDQIHPPLGSPCHDQTIITINRAAAAHSQPANRARGTASWYARGLRNPRALTAASRDYPRGSRLQVTSRDTGKSVIVTINDYGPEAWTGRIIDLSSGAFAELQALHLGLTEVEIIPIDL